MLDGFDAHTDEITALEWAGPDKLVSGGADGAVVGLLRGNIGSRRRRGEGRVDAAATTRMIREPPRGRRSSATTRMVREPPRGRTSSTQPVEKAAPDSLVNTQVIYSPARHGESSLFELVEAEEYDEDDDDEDEDDEPIDALSVLSADPEDGPRRRRGFGVDGPSRGERDPC